MSDNPYSTPSAQLAADLHGEATEPAELRLATTRQRALTFVLDLIFGYLLLMFSKSLMILLVDSLSLLDTFFIAYYFVAYFLYYLIFELVWGYTPAKLVMATRVVSKTGTNASLSQLLIRSLCRYIPFEFLSFLFVKPAQAGKPVGWHDQLSATRVIDVRYI